MPYDHPEPADPTMRIGVAVPGDAETTREMAYAFAEEFARLGFGESRLVRLFQSPFYSGLHRAYAELGERAIREIVRECVHAWGGPAARAAGAAREGA